ncbi:hypothetical protein BDM02DRAFT_3120060, partial [Thelephora ganbajun]
STSMSLEAFSVLTVRPILRPKRVDETSLVRNAWKHAEIRRTTNYPTFFSARVCSCELP